MGYKTEFFGRVSIAEGNSTSNPTDGSGVPVPWIITDIPKGLSKHFISVSVYAEPDMTKPIHPAGMGPGHLVGGTVKVQASDDGCNFGDITNGTIDLSKADYPRPNMCGPLAALKVLVTGVNPPHVTPVGHLPNHGVTVRVQINSY